MCQRTVHFIPNTFKFNSPNESDICKHQYSMYFVLNAQISLHENEFLCSLWQRKETFMFFYGTP